MSIALVSAGALLVLLALADAVVTTIAVGAGAGPFTRLTIRLLWRAAQTSSHGQGHSRVQRSGGPLALLVTLLGWVLLLTGGWLMIFTSVSPAVVSSTTAQPASLVERLYYVGFTVFTLGIGDFVPGGDVWRVLTVISTFSGLFLITLSVTYVLSVVSAVVDGRAGQ